MKVSISRSVGRAFAVMEHFRDLQEPANATQLSRRLHAPHSSVVAVLHNLRELGYLSFDETDMTYFPTTKLLDIADWLRPPPRENGQIGILVDRVARDTGHMTALSSRLSLFVNTVAVRPGRFSAVSAPARSVGAALTASVSGHVILAQLDDDEVAEIMRETEAWQRTAGARKSFDNAATFANIDVARRKGFLSGAHPTCRGTEIIAHAVKGAEAAPCALSLHIPACLSRGGKEEVTQVLQTRVRECQSGTVRPATRLGSLPAVRRPSGRAQDFNTRLPPCARDGMAPSRMLAARPDAG